MTTIDITDLVKSDLEARREKGIKEYGKPLESDSEIDALWYAYEEALDLAGYIRLEIWKRDNK